MLNSVGSSALYSYAVPVRQSSAGLEAQLEQYRKKLVDCISCSSSKTPEGHKNIEELSNKISQLQARINEIHAAKVTVQKPAHEAPVEKDVNRYSASVGYDANGLIAAKSASENTNVGSQLDVYA